MSKKNDETFSFNFDYFLYADKAILRRYVNVKNSLFSNFEILENGNVTESDIFDDFFGEFSNETSYISNDPSYGMSDLFIFSIITKIDCRSNF